MKVPDNTNVHNELCVGIDLGTTNSVLATINTRPNGNIISKVVDISRAVDIYNSIASEARLSTMKKPTLPSCVYYRQEKGYEPLVGDFAKMQYALRPHLVAKSIKSQMGKPLAEGLSPDIPDITPAQISARILQHMLRETEKVYKCRITEAVITVPANFDSAMCKATRDAAEIAGITVRNKDGSERPVLLSEPNAVIYDLMNQIHNGEISSQILDLSTEKLVLVFDLGGGTLDITLHKIRKRNAASDVLKVDEISTNRYTLLGGDDFDEAIAEEMYLRYQKQYVRNASVTALLQQKKPVIMAQLRNYAENVKLDLSMQCSNENSSNWGSGWDDDEEEITIPTGGSMGGIGYPYDDTFTKDEIESVLSSFMGKSLKYEDYKRIASITETRNIIYPILDVLSKGAQQLNIKDVKVDAVIVNGGMSKFYMITDRLKRFFGFDPIVALDPDQSVARGAAVYHHLLRQHAEMAEDMKHVGDDRKNAASTSKSTNAFDIKLATILNDALYLGLKNDDVELLVPTGESLPYNSAVLTGFRIDSNQTRVDIPIKCRNIDGTYRTIAQGIMSFTHIYPNGANVAISIHMSVSKVLSMKAWTYVDSFGKVHLEEGSTEIAIGNQTPGKSAPSRPTTTATAATTNNGIRLNAEGEIDRIVQTSNKMRMSSNPHTTSKYAADLRSIATQIRNCANTDDFARPILNVLKKPSVSDEARTRLFVLSRKICSTWSLADRQQLITVCLQQLAPYINGLSAYGTKINANAQAIYTMSVSDNASDLKKLIPLHGKYREACLYAHAKTQTEIPWIISQLNIDATNAIKQQNYSPLQGSAHAIAVSLANNEQCKTSAVEREKVLGVLLQAIQGGRLSYDVLVVCLIALGTMCDNRIVPVPFSSIKTREVDRCLQGIYQIYPSRSRIERAVDTALKLLHGDTLTSNEEKFLLSKLEL